MSDYFSHAEICMINEMAQKFGISGEVLRQEILECERKNRDCDFIKMEVAYWKKRLDEHFDQLAKERCK